MRRQGGPADAGRISCYQQNYIGFMGKPRRILKPPRFPLDAGLVEWAKYSAGTGYAALGLIVQTGRNKRHPALAERGARFGGRMQAAARKRLRCVVILMAPVLVRLDAAPVTSAQSQRAEAGPVR